MVRKIYDGYDYIDPDNLYTYPHSSVLINKFNEKNDNKAREVNTVSDILKIHKFLFEGMYTWAGQYRQVNISKSGNAFMPVQSFDMAEKYLNTLISNYLLNANNKIEICKSLAEILDNLNYFHPFREGNGRTQREVIRSLALMKGYECEISIGLDDDIYHLYMDGTVYGDTSKLEQLFNKLLTEI